MDYRATGEADPRTDIAEENLKTEHHAAAVASLSAAKREVLRLIYRGPSGADRRPLTDVVDAIDRAINAIRAELPGVHARNPREVRILRE